MRRLASLLVLAAACAHAPRPILADHWHELRSEHFTLRTDLPLDDARRAVVDLEEVRAGLLAVSWHAATSSSERTQVIEFADAEEMQDYAVPGMAGFVTGDAFDDPIMVFNGSRTARQRIFLNHELAHVITNEFLVRNPYWVAEGLACYLETLRIDATAGRVEVGSPDEDRLEFLLHEPAYGYWSLMRNSRGVWDMSARDGYAFESNAFILVHWLIDTRPAAFEKMMRSLARGEDRYYAFSSSFPDLTENSMRQGIDAYTKNAKTRMGLRTAKVAPWKGDVVQRPLPPGEVYALLADLQRISPGYGETPERSARLQSLLASALKEDPGNPLALKISKGGDAGLSTRQHPDDWRAWVLLADRNPDDRTSIEKAAELAPDNPNVLSRLAWADQERGDQALALRHAARAVELAPARPWTLDTLAHMEAAAGKCAEAVVREQHAIDVLPDGVSRAFANEFRGRRAELENHCTARTARVEHSVAGAPVLKGCKAKRPKLGKRDSVHGVIAAEFNIAGDGTVSGVKLTGDASTGVLAAVRKYLESCTYEPLRDGGKPVASEAQGEFHFQP